MMTLHNVIIYITVAFVSYITPGADWLIISRYAASNIRDGLVAACGVQSGLLAHMFIGALGAVFIMESSLKLFFILQFFGALYLMYLGASIFRDDATALGDDHLSDKNLRYTTPYRQGLIANLLNPKAALFFISILPQFVSNSGNRVLQVFFLGFVDIATGMFWWLLFVYFFSYISKRLGGDSFRYYVDRITGAVLISIGVYFFCKIFFFSL